MTFRGLDATLLSSHPGSTSRIVRVTVSTDRWSRTMDMELSDEELTDVSDAIRQIAEAAGLVCMTATEGE